MAKIDLRNIRPGVERLPDGRQRATFAFRVREWVGRTKAEILAECWLAWGTEAPGDFTGLRLIAQELQGLKPNDDGSLPLVRVFEELPATAEIQVGLNTIVLDEDGRRNVVAEFLQFSDATATPGTVGTTTAPGDANAFLKTEEAPSDGTLRRIKRTFVYAGTISTNDEIGEGGALLKKTIVSVKTVPSTPSGFTLIGSPVQNPNGLPVYNYAFVRGAGRVSSDVSFKQNGKLKITTIRFLGADDAATPAGTLVNDDSKNQDGYTVFTRGYAEIVGDGVTTDLSEVKDGGTLILYRRIRLGTVPDTPSATISGTVTLVSSTTRQEDGFILYDYQWAEGVGEISRKTDYSQSNDAGTTGATSITIRHLSSLATVSNPISTPASTILVAIDDDTQDGYRIWTAVYARGAGVVLTKSARSNNGKLITYTRVALGSAPDTPSATISGTVVLVDSDQRKENGFDVFTSIFAEGRGVISKSTQAREGGLRLETWVSLGTTYDAAYMLPPGVLMLRDDDDSDGVVRWTVTSIQNAGGGSPLVGTGVASVDVVSVNTNYGAAPTVSFSGGGGSGAAATAILTDGVLTGFTVTAAGSGYTSAPLVTLSVGSDTAVAVLSGTAVSRERFANFTYPGRAQAVDLVHPDWSTLRSLDIQLSPPIDARLIATEEISYRADNSLSDLTYPIWNPMEWATVLAQFRASTSTNQAVTRIEGLRGYRAVGGVSSVSYSISAGVNQVSVMGTEALATGGNYLKVFGGPDSPDGQTFTLEAECELAFIGFDGTRYYRRTVVYAVIPAQHPMPTMSSVVMISTGVTSIATLKAVTTSGVAVGGRTNSFPYIRFIMNGIFTDTARGILVAGTLASDTASFIRPNDYDASTNAKYWHLT